MPLNDSGLNKEEESNTFSGNYDDLTGVPSAFAPESHGDGAHSPDYAKQSDLHTKYTDSNAQSAVDGTDRTFTSVTINDIMSISPKSSVPSSPSANDVYLDDGTNTSSGNAGLRYYDGSAWSDL